MNSTLVMHASSRARVLGALLIVAIGLWSGAASGQDGPAGVPQSLPLSSLMVETAAKGDVALSVQVADTDAARQTGLMFRTEMPEREGMLFIFPELARVSFWMKNTYIPLDLLFIGDDGTILQITRETEPFSLAPIPSERPARAVLEINGGASARLGIAVGDRLRHDLFSRPAPPSAPRP
ncbi:DUF192 domain-containing protein [Iodidimonas sp. SYSU 1G8]|uniref:DUF192 domain-containing protein n=1 Tax=Iodidimonas sp. SYSU 1G8 TaxID=3133967 RepID=UPI0031FE6F34